LSQNPEIGAERERIDLATEFKFDLEDPRWKNYANSPKFEDSP
jgi:hypothetical protein